MKKKLRNEVDGRLTNTVAGDGDDEGNTQGNGGLQMAKSPRMVDIFIFSSLASYSSSPKQLFYSEWSQAYMLPAMALLHTH